ncbi:hypothetical protein ACP70R_022882 [Stipagrostis hirtigluma subsp. patula]
MSKTGEFFLRSDLSGGRRQRDRSSLHRAAAKSKLHPPINKLPDVLMEPTHLCRNIRGCP